MSFYCVLAEAEAGDDFGSLLPVHPEYLRCDSVYSTRVGRRDGWLARGIPHRLYLLSLCKYALKIPP